MIVTSLNLSNGLEEYLIFFYLTMRPCAKLRGAPTPLIYAFKTRVTPYYFHGTSRIIVCPFSQENANNYFLTIIFISKNMIEIVMIHSHCHLHHFTLNYTPWHKMDFLQGYIGHYYKLKRKWQHPTHSNGY